MRSNYDFLLSSVCGCHSPKYVYNSLGKRIRVSCGHCYNCLNNKRVSKVRSIQLEAVGHKYCNFITLTYNNKSIPYARLEKRFKNLIDYDCVLVSDNPRFKNYGSVIAEINTESEFLKYCSYQSALPKRFCYCDISDIQLFLKRLRININRFVCNETLRYYVVSEYGPKTLRPHYHLLLFYSNPKINSYLRENLSKIWKFGFVYSTLANKSCGVASYVASYVNSSVSLPYFINASESKIRTFSSHSVQFGSKFYEPLRKVIYNSPFKFSDFNRCEFFDGQQVRFVYPSRTVRNSFFPKIPRFCSHYVDTLQYIYKASWKIIVELYDSNFSSLVDYLLTTYYKDKTLSSIKPYMRTLIFDLFRYLSIRHMNFNSIVSHYDSVNRSRLSSTFLGVSKAFTFIYPFFCNWNDVVKCIYDYYNFCDYENLKQQLSLLSDNSYILDKYTLSLLYDSSILESFPSLDESLEKSPYHCLRYHTDELKFYNAIKHKSINDRLINFISNS